MNSSCSYITAFRRGFRNAGAIRLAAGLFAVINAVDGIHDPGNIRTSKIGFGLYACLKSLRPVRYSEVERIIARPRRRSNCSGKLANSQVGGRLNVGRKVVINCGRTGSWLRGDKKVFYRAIRFSRLVRTRSKFHGPGNWSKRGYISSRRLVKRRRRRVEL
jgi:hypothetical protein